jgi:hypothetical protein
MRGLLVVGLVVELLGGCYSPAPPTGAPCPDGLCPDGLVCSPATRTCEHVGVPVDGAIDVPFDASPGIDTPTSPFKFRRRLSIKNGSNATLPIGFTLRITGPSVTSIFAKAKPDLSDVRVIGDGVLGERHRVVDPASGPAPAAISFALAEPIAAGATTTAYAVYYGDPNAGAPPADGTKVFPIYDDFATGIASFWMKNEAPAANNGQLLLRGGHQDALTTNAAADGLPLTSAIEIIATVVNPTSDPTPTPDGTFFYWFGYQHTGDFSASDPWVVWIARGKGQVHAEQKSPVGCEAECDGPQVNQDTAPHHYMIERDPAASRFFRDGTLSFTATVTNSQDYSVMVRNFMAAGDVRIDYIRARARVTPDPMVSVGAEEAL